MVIRSPCFSCTGSSITDPFTCVGFVALKLNNVAFCPLISILQCCLDTTGSWMRMSHSMPLPNKQVLRLSGKWGPSTPLLLMVTRRPVGPIFKTRI